MSKREEIKAYVNDFVEGLTKRMRAAAIEGVDIAFQNGEAEVEAMAAKRGRAKALRTTRSVRALPPPSGDVTTSEVLAAVKANQGSRCEVIAGHIGKTAKQIKQPLSELVATGRVKKSGNGRGTTYTAGR